MRHAHPIDRLGDALAVWIFADELLIVRPHVRGSLSEFVDVSDAEDCLLKEACTGLSIHASECSNRFLDFSFGTQRIAEEELGFFSER